LSNNPELLAQAQALPERQKYRLIEVLDTDIAHYEFFLSRPPLLKADWSIDRNILDVIPQRHPCLSGWESKSLFDPDYQLVKLSDLDFQFMQACDRNVTVAEILASHPDMNLDLVRSLLQGRLILLPAI
jgi:hypothetical protein